MEYQYAPIWGEKEVDFWRKLPSFYPKIVSFSDILPANGRFLAGHFLHMAI
ncbi:MAG: hypothetical protein MPJ24_11855 [Pirellulaceae bacterium]|nr:hypothetical protein [Pirellulaceae bacterium]